jgi:non-ribosomal peptide synthetase component F
MRLTVGMVSKILPLRVSIDLKVGFGDLLQRISGRIREMLRHQRYGAEELRHDLGLRPEESGIYGTVVNIMSFGYDLHFAGYPAQAHNLSLGPVDEFTIAVYDRRDGSDLRIDFDANPANYSAESVASHQRRFLALLAHLAVAMPELSLDLFERPTVEAVAARHVHLLEGAVAAPDVPLPPIGNPGAR